ncbi:MULTISPECIES: hypothetical protein [unclassified Microcoleus]|uniref:hypothetical protein n=1 Tax=unclassified Microcoleus TaxID=2642155 RepID=UPI002FCF0C5F
MKAAISEIVDICYTNLAKLNLCFTIPVEVFSLFGLIPASTCMNGIILVNKRKFGWSNALFFE